MRPLTLGSLFTGIGGLDLGLERAGFQVQWQVEIDDYATRVLEKHWPAVTRHRDVREAGAHNLEPVDLIAGGFPCQGVSDLGGRRGLEDERSGLWREYVRIIRELRPRYILVENVAALLRRGLSRVLGDLASVGYDAEWSVLSACALGAPHTRERLFIVAYPNGLYGDKGLGFIQDWPPALQPGNDYAGAGFWLEGPRVHAGMADGVFTDVDAGRGLGNAVVPQLAELLGRWIVDFDRRRQEGGVI